jgi:hypothetical protein
MQKFVIILLIVLTGISCSPQKKLARKFNGEGREVLIKQFGEPHREARFDDGKTLVVFRKEQVIRPTTVSTGRFTPDPMVSPGYLKIEEKHFILDEKGIVIQSLLKKEIER